MTLEEFLLARIAEDEAVAAAMDDAFDPVSWVGYSLPAVGLDGPIDGPTGYSAIIIDPERVLAECRAKRAIVELHKRWPVLVQGPPSFDVPAGVSGNAGQTSGGGGGGDVGSMVASMSRRVAWSTQEEYRRRFGAEPPTAPMLIAMAAVYATHPDYDEAWRP